MLSKRPIHGGHAVTADAVDAEHANDGGSCHKQGCVLTKALAATEITAGPPDGLSALTTTAQLPVQRISGRDGSKHHNATLSDAHGVDVIHQEHGEADNTESFEAVL